ncbi:uncharacterized protein LOC116021122 [Ipomoea triloba]|uniref:uncharacterized protein LOC116021122 n=1 Tax=Ipomoea triloba TaxID=35885 RepID=UPI00125E6A63|nr:uncharacterized protein LOC116021122 [Ipomoea triloba]
MSLLSWNCRGLGNPTAVRVLTDLVRAKRPKVLFLMETFVDKRKMELVRVQNGYDSMFVVDAIGHRGGLALLWMNSVEVEVTAFSSNFIDVQLALDVGKPYWRFTGFYGLPERHRRRESWQLLRSLATHSNLPWVIMGDFNDLLNQADKRGRLPHPEWLITGFREAVNDCGLRELPFDGHQFTWEWSRGTANMVEEKLDRIFTIESWLSLYDGAQASSLICPYSDHLPLMLSPESLNRPGSRRRFCFDNMWLREDKCREIVAQSWERTRGMDVITRVECCGRDIWRWGRNYNKEFQRKIEKCKGRLAYLRNRHDSESMMEYPRVEKELLFLLEQQHIF